MNHLSPILGAGAEGDGTSWSNISETSNDDNYKCVTCHYCKAPTLDQTPSYDSCENCGYWHCYSDGEGWIPEQYQKEEL